ncbi:N(G),N(G)-dimethylarginine dimethylaminohydrolase [metagenome]|uniref:N(G),N(G)-dimethylarginine dimethylaminohydrolase n=1 Tax=metagenome TaxID=256318 RepID=A0A2P2C9M2_9ZZZZ
MSRIALVRRPTDDLADGIVTHIERTPVDVERAFAQHTAYAEALAAAGWDVRHVEPAPGCPDAVFVEDSVVVVEGTAVITRPGAPARRGEIAGTEAAVRELGLEVRRIEGDGTLDGGDVLQVGDTVYVGRGGRTNADGICQLREHLSPLGRTVVPVRLLDVLHLKSAVTALPDGTLLALPELMEPGVFATTRPVDEEGGCHVVPLGGSDILIAASAPRTIDRLADLGFSPRVVDISEFEKLEGCVTCLSVLVR